MGVGRRVAAFGDSKGDARRGSAASAVSSPARSAQRVTGVHRRRAATNAQAVTTLVMAAIIGASPAGQPIIAMAEMPLPPRAEGDSPGAFGGLGESVNRATITASSGADSIDPSKMGLTLCDE